MSDEFTFSWLQKDIHTLGWFKSLWVRIFGKRQVYFCDGWICESYFYKGKFYIAKHHKKELHK